jgi:pimeloyl-ACP methyl ester carboxylesterase
MTSLVVLHGYTMNGDTMRAHMAGLAARFPGGLRVIYASAPHACSEASVERFYGGSSLTRLAAPHLMWWDATDDGREYRGWEETRDHLRALFQQHSPAGVLGFSQGGILAAALAASSMDGQFPAPRFAILIAGRTPRATVFEPLFARAIAVPSLHVWGERDGMAEGSRGLVDHFQESTRQVVTWPGPHRVPVEGPAADAIADFVQRYTSS